MKKAIVFDFFKTLVCVDVDTPPVWQLVTQAGYPVSSIYDRLWLPEAFDGEKHPRLQDAPGYLSWRRAHLFQYLHNAGVPSAQREKLVNEILRVDGLWTVKPLPGAQDALNASAAAGFRIGICSNWDYPLEPYILQANLLSIHAVSSSACVGARKPHPLIFNDIARKIGYPPSQCYFVGDQWHTDILGSIRCGFHAVWINSESAATPTPQNIVIFPDLLTLTRAIENYSLR